MHKVILTGGAGFIGSHTYVALVEAGFDVVIIDNFTNAKRSVIDRLALLTKSPVKVIDADIRDRSALISAFEQHQPQGVVHFAALKAVGESFKRPQDYFSNNIGGLISLLDAMRYVDCKKLVFSSSATVYGDQAIQPIPEDAPRSHASPYAFTKLIGEQILEQLCENDPTWACGILRYFNPVGAHESALIGEDPTGTPENLIPIIAQVAMGLREKLQVFGDDYDTPDGTGIRDYIHVCDLALAHVKSLELLFTQSQSHSVNIGTGRGHSVLELLHAYSKTVGRDLPFEIIARRSGDVRELTASAQKAQDVLGFKAKRNLQDMCETSWAWVQAAAGKNSG